MELFFSYSLLCIPNEFELFFLLCIPNEFEFLFSCIVYNAVDLYFAFLFHCYSYGGDVSANGEMEYLLCYPPFRFVPSIQTEF